jgi:hypothetical protein
MYELASPDDGCVLNWHCYTRRYLLRAIHRVHASTRRHRLPLSLGAPIGHAGGRRVAAPRSLSKRLAKPGRPVLPDAHLMQHDVGGSTFFTDQLIIAARVPVSEEAGSLAMQVRLANAGGVRGHQAQQQPRERTGMNIR